MAPYNHCWVKPSFLNLLRDSCDAYLESSDRGMDKTQSKLITKVSGEIAAIVERTNEPVPDDLEKCVRTWFGNYAAAHAKEDRPEKSKSDRRGHPASSWTWTVKSRLSDDGEKDIRNYHPALTNVFDTLTAEQRKQCKDLAVEWNTKPLPDHVQLRLKNP
ncbi:hypothetical protein BJV78DRAFT_1289978 [Lactifluus subvellereus]|nr:hypothetical protein BJV78DRAFT_1289978 [Lactifluus subvellereus]